MAGSGVATQNGARNSGSGGSPIAGVAVEEISILPDGVAKPASRYFSQTVLFSVERPRERGNVSYVGGGRRS
jgi:hypothetical protein